MQRVCQVVEVYDRGEGEDERRAGSFFDWASTSPLCDGARRFRRRYLSRFEEAVDAPSQLSVDTAELDNLRQSLRTLFRVPSSYDVVLGRSVTELMTVMAMGLQLTRSRVVVSDVDHPAAVMPWVGAAFPKWNVHVVRSDGRGRLDVDEASASVDDRAAVVSITHVSHISGVIQPVEEIAQVARAHGALSVVDGAQAVGRIPVDVESIGCDAYIGVSRKALRGPLGTGFLLARREVLERLRPMLLSTRAASLEGLTSSDDLKISLVPLPARLEGNLPDMAALHAMWGAVEEAHAIGVESVYSHACDLMQVVAAGLDRLGFRCSGHSLDGNAGIASFSHPRVDGEELQARLRAKGIVVAGSADAIRISVHLTNSPADVERLVQEVENVVAQ